MKIFEKTPPVIQIWSFLILCYLVSYLILGNEVFSSSFYNGKIFSIIITIASVFGIIIFISLISEFRDNVKTNKLFFIKATFYFLYTELTINFFLMLLIFIPLDICTLGERLGL